MQYIVFYDAQYPWGELEVFGQFQNFSNILLMIDNRQYNNPILIGRGGVG